MPIPPLLAHHWIVFRHEDKKHAAELFSCACVGVDSLEGWSGTSLRTVPVSAHPGAKRGLRVHGKTTECCGQPTRPRWPDFRRLQWRKVRLERRGFVGPVIASAEASTWRHPGVWRPRALRCPAPIQASKAAPPPRAAQDASLPLAHAQGPQQCVLSTARVRIGLSRGARGSTASRNGSRCD